MKNELLLILSVVLIYGAVLLFYRLFGKSGMYAITVLATVLANIEVLILIRAFGMTQTLGNVMFAATYVATDILSENHGKKKASRAVGLGMLASVMMVLVTGLWLLFTPAEGDFAMPAIRTLFSMTPRLILASLVGYAVSQFFDVWLYHRIWQFTEEKSGDKTRFLWLRNNAATMSAQLVNTVLFNSIAFFGVYDLKTLLSIMLSSYLIYIVTALLDTPVVYLARFLKRSGKIPQSPEATAE